MISGTVSHYEIVGKLGEGGMGVVYKARDTRLDRFVALKFLPSHIGPDDAERARFMQEARAVSALDHPNICTIHDLERTDDGMAFIVMACYEGETLRERMQRGPLPLADAVAIARQIAQGLSRAHDRGIVHRDVKPANIFLTRDGIVKVLDFGIARLLDETRMTREGTAIGTAGYMAPEQARGEAVDRRADVWALGVILYEMLAGKPAFVGERTPAVLNAILTRDPEPLDVARADAPRALVEVVGRALQKEPGQRFADASAFAVALTGIESTLRDASAPAPAIASLRRPIVAIPLVGGVLVLMGMIGWLGLNASRSRWARNEALPQIGKLAEGRRFGEAVALANSAERYIPGDPVLERLWRDIAVTINIESTPSGALVELRPYANKAGAWRAVGTTPLRDLRLARGAYRWRFSKTGSDTLDRAEQALTGTLRVALPPAGSVPDGFVRIAQGSEALMIAGYGLPQEIALREFFLQRYEVTNREYRKFVDAGGYRRKELWRHEFKDKDRTLLWEEAMAMFRDKAGQPGPATWEVGAYPSGQDDYPVGGLSWFEAAAYAEFMQLQLPTVAHWYRAAGLNAGSFLLPLANFDYRGPIAVGQSGAMSPSGAVDMAGNVREWIWNPTAAGERYILGGGSGDPQYMFGQIEAQSPFDRSPLNGFRCVRYTGDGRPDAGTAAPVTRVARDYRREAPVPDETFAQFVRMQQYAPSPLDVRQEKSIDGQDVKVERVSFTAAYAGERVVAYLWLPKSAKPPYQTLLLFPGAESMRPGGPDLLEQPDRYDFLVRSGRAVVHPVYYGMYERFVPRPTDPIARRDLSLRWAQDVHRTLDYLETRPDIDTSKIGYFGLSMGAGFSPVVLATDPRLKLALLMGGGLISSRYEPEVEPANYAPRVKQPLLLLCGRYDYFIPYETAQKAFFDLIGTSPEHKKHVVVESGHAVPRAEYLREVLSWLDRYFGTAR